MEDVTTEEGGHQRHQEDGRYRGGVTVPLKKTAWWSLLEPGPRLDE